MMLRRQSAALRALTLPALALALALLLPAAATALEPLTIALSGNYLPLHGTAGRSMIGFEAELAQALGKALGRPIRFVDTRKAFKLGTIDAVAAGKVELGMNSITPTPERAEKVDFTMPYLVLHYALAGKKTGLQQAQLAALTDRVAVPSAAVREAVQQAMPRAALVDCANLGAGIALVEQGKADWVAYEDVGLHLGVRLAPLAVAAPRFGRSPLAIATAKGKAAAVDAALKSLAPEIAELERKWKPGEDHFSTAEDRLLGTLPKNLLGLVEQGGRLVRPEYCYAESPSISLQRGQDGKWTLWAALGQDSAMLPIQHAGSARKGVYRLKGRMDAYGQGALAVHELARGDAPGLWTCDGCHPACKVFVDEAHQKAYPTHDYDADSRDENGDCGPP